MRDCFPVHYIEGDENNKTNRTLQAISLQNLITVITIYCHQKSSCDDKKSTIEKNVHPLFISITLFGRPVANLHFSWHVIHASSIISIFYPFQLFSSFANILNECAMC